MAKHRPKGVTSGVELNVTKNPGNYIGHHRLESQEMLFDLGMIDEYMKFYGYVEVKVVREE